MLGIFKKILGIFGNFEKMFSAKSRDFRYVFGDFGPKISGNTEKNGKWKSRKLKKGNEN